MAKPLSVSSEPALVRREESFSSQPALARREESGISQPALVSFDDSEGPNFKTNSFYGFPASYHLDEDEPDAPGRNAQAAKELEGRSAAMRDGAKLLEQQAEMLKLQAAYTSAMEGQAPGGMPFNYGNLPFPGGMPMPGMHPMMMMGGMPYPGGMMPGMPMMPMAGGYPDLTDASGQSADPSASKDKTTVMWKNLPNNYTRDDLLALIDSKDFRGSYDFFYAPVDFTSQALVGYAFVNFVSTKEADRFYDCFQNYKDWPTLKSEKVSVVTWSQPLQGLEGHIERYRNSPVMHPDVADDKRPVLFRGGERIPFPPPTKKLRPPHLKDCRPKA